MVARELYLIIFEIGFQRKKRERQGVRGYCNFCILRSEARAGIGIGLGVGHVSSDISVVQ